MRHTDPVRVVASFVGGWGHAEPLVPVARVAQARGHRVTFAGQARVVPRLGELGFATAVVGPDTFSDDRPPLRPVDREGERAVMRDHFVARFGDVRATALGELLERERAGLVVCDEVDVGAVVAAERLGVPCVTVSVLAAGRLSAPDVVGPAWDRLRADHGLPADPGGVALGGTVAVVPAPRSFRDPSLGWRSSRHAVRPPILDEAVRHPPGDRPFVYATLGTVFNVESGDLLARLADALGRLDADALLTVGPSIDPAELGDVAPNVRVAPFVPQRDVLGRCDAVVCHGGSGTLVAALSLGVPVVVLPMGADQPDNADRCEELGVGVSLEPVTVDATEIAGAVDAVLGDPDVREAASRLADEAAAQPPLDRLPALLELV